ncbi:MAG: ribonuclease H [Thermodesulfobacteriota bacterium]|nr:ribonuclease H [Thermodesulfobacteriota bacterium]
MTDPYAWERMMFKGHKVWLAVDNHQHPIVKNHKVLIKYQKDQDYEYWVPQKAVQTIDPNRLTKKGRPKKTAGRAVPGRSPSPTAPDQPGTIVVYTDGASSGNPGPAGIGVVLRFESREKEISTYIGTSTNNMAELMAIKTALEAIRTTHIPVNLYTDSQYCYGLLVLGWKAKRNQELVTATKKLMKRFKQLSIRKVEGHAGIPDNERADRLARSAVHRGSGT